MTPEQSIGLYSFAGCRVPEDEQCKLCKGERCEQVQKIIEVNVHPGARHGEKIKFPNEGDQTDVRHFFEMFKNLKTL